MEPPKRVRDVIREITGDLTMNGGVEAMMGRVKEFENPLAAKLAGIATHPLARARFDAELDQMWANTPVPSEVPEVVIGGGLHAAIYCAARVAQGCPKPLVIEEGERAGGIFAVSTMPSFFLNSRNRPGELGVPGRDEALNFIPFAPVQPADLGGDEYQTNTEMAFAIRATLAMNARVVTGRKVLRAQNRRVILTDQTVIDCERAIYATGIGEALVPPGENCDGERLLSYTQFLASLDKPFPLEGMRSVAVVGAGDSGRTVIEALIGQGPPRTDTVASLDWVERIDWFGVDPESHDREGWERCNRSRYKGIGRAMPRPARPEQADGRIRPIARRARFVSTSYNGAYVDGVRYDKVIWCAGYSQGSAEQADRINGNPVVVGGREVARENNRNVFAIGPCARLDYTVPPGTQGVPENTVALFRYADLTANFAMSLPVKPKPQKKKVGFFSSRAVADSYARTTSSP